MKPIKYTDSLRYPHGYKRAAETDITRTFARARAANEAKRKEQEENAAEATAKVRAMKGAK